MSEATAAGWPSAAGRYDHFLGGTAHSAADRAAGAKIRAIGPEVIDDGGTRRWPAGNRAKGGEDGAVAHRPRDLPMTQHQPVRPAWTCTGDGQPWPCPIARLRLRSRYAGDSTRLAVYMSTLLMAAAADSGYRGVLPPELFNRFMAWTG